MPKDEKALGRGVNDIASPDKKRSVRNQYLSKRLQAAGSRPILEALIDVENGRSVEDVLEDFARIPSSIYRLVGASSFARILNIIKRSS